jgi:hypothetical protein
MSYAALRRRFASLGITLSCAKMDKNGITHKYGAKQRNGATTYFDNLREVADYLEDLEHYQDEINNSVIVMKF